MGVEQDRGLVRIEMPVLHPNVVHPAVCVDMTAFKKILNHEGHLLFLLAKRRSGDHFLKQVKRVFEKLLHTHSISTCPGSFLCLSCDQRSCRIIARVSQQIGRVPDEHFLNTLMNGRKGVLQLGKNTVGEGMFRKQFLVSLFRKACDDAVVVVDVKQYTLFLETIDQPYVVTIASRNRERGRNRIGIRVQYFSLAMCQRSDYWNKLVLQ